MIYLLDRPSDYDPEHSRIMVIVAGSKKEARALASINCCSLACCGLWFHDRFTKCRELSADGLPCVVCIEPDTTGDRGNTNEKV